MCHKFKIGLIRAQELFIGRGRFSWGGGGLHFSNWRGKNIEYFVMTRMALGMQPYGAGKLSPTPRDPP